MSSYEVVIQIFSYLLFFCVEVVINFQFSTSQQAILKRHQLTVQNLFVILQLCFLIFIKRSLQSVPIVCTRLDCYRSLFYDFVDSISQCTLGNRICSTGRLNSHFFCNFQQLLSYSLYPIIYQFFPWFLEKNTKSLKKIGGYYTTPISALSNTTHFNFV